jgi:hypothetical protein
MDPAEEMEWLDEQETYVLKYLAREGVAPAGELEIQWSLAPYVSIWTLQTEGAGRIWVICGDLPTDYIRNASLPDARSAARAFGQRWSEVASHLTQGRQHPTIRIGSGLESKGAEKELGELLRRRAEQLIRWSDDPAVWEE